MSEKSLESSILLAQNHILSHRHDDGYWWYTLEANDTINAEYIMLLRYLDHDQPAIIQGICNGMLKNQNSDGSWSLYHEGPGDLSTTVECYLALKMAGFLPTDPALQRAKHFILAQGGLTQIRIFSRIHLALFGLVSWDICPQMPVFLMSMSHKMPINIYEFSSWARACVVPLLVILDQKPVKKIPELSLDELYLTKPSEAQWPKTLKEIKLLSIESLFVTLDKILQVTEKIKVKPLRKRSLRKCEKYITEHLAQTEDIYPAMYYGLLALLCLGYDFNHSSVQKALRGIQSFQLPISRDIDKNSADWIQELSFKNNYLKDKSLSLHKENLIYQQCCISPVWDTAWASVALLESGISPQNEKIISSAKWLLDRQITDTYGDWAVKNTGVAPGGWSFQFHNKHYPDVDDTMEVLTLLHALHPAESELSQPFQKGLTWLCSMQSKNGGFAAFDKDNQLELLNKIPFSDHGACLDQPTVDLSGRFIEFMVNTLGHDHTHPAIQKAADFIVKRQEPDGSFWGRWGVNYIYGTWCVLCGLGALQRPQDKKIIEKSISWIKSIQHADGGFGEDCASYAAQKFVDLSTSTPSQTAWALLGLIAAGEAKSLNAQKAAEFLINSQTPDGGWHERHHTGTGFPGHFYLRYHGYRYYFPLLALGKYRQALKNNS